ncbi:MAG TPA: hypothetical protein DDY64_03475 [Streptococcus sp.]|nr:hypothetical protein [Streptococcus sp.]
MFTKNKFQYCIYNHERLELHELQKEYQNDKVSTKLKYENQLFCPGCYKVDLIINEKKGKIYLSSHPKSPHGDGCEYALDSASKMKLKEYYEKIDADLAVQLLERILEEKTIRATRIGNANSSKDNNQGSDLKFVLENKDGIRKYLPRRSLLLNELEVSDHLTMYYGECKVFIGKTDKKYYLRMFRNNDQAKYICNLVIPERVYKYLENELRFIPQSKDLSFKHSRANAVPVKLAFVSTMKKKHEYYNSYLGFSKLLRVKRME